MEEKPQNSTQVIRNTNEEDEIRDAEEFYEKIEAPKFVDFTIPDRYRPDDRYWFCLRVGCDQKHEEEIDHEAISKNFVLRVMAARSPNIRLRKALNRKSSSVKEQCPLSAPAKPTKSRLSRLAVISSISQKMADTKGKHKPLSKLTSTPNLKGKQVAAKYLTTPRHKICSQNTNKSFRSVQNSKPTNIEEPKNKVVAKALVFQSPKKGICVKTSAELRTPLTKICESMKRLEIASQKKRILGYSNKSLKEIKGDCNKLSRADALRKKESGCKDKSKANVVRPLSSKEQKSKLLRSMKRKSKGNSNTFFEFVPKAVVESESSDMEIDMKSRVSEGRNPDTVLANASRDDIQSPSSTEEERGSEENNLFKANTEEGKESGEGLDQEEKIKAVPEKGGYSENQSMESETLGGVRGEDEEMDNDDKENVLASDSNRDFGNNDHQCGGKMLGKKEMNRVLKRVVKTQQRNLKEGPTMAAAGAQFVKYKKPKPTNPKPFRLRTDERGILREANLERRVHPLVPHQETERDLTLPSGTLNKKQGNETEKHNKLAEQSTKEREMRPKTACITPKRRPNSTTQRKPKVSPLEYGRDVIGQKSEKGIRKTKSPSLHGQFTGPNGVASNLKQTSSTKSGEKSNGLRSVLREKRPATIPKEPNFHSVHVPKNCAKKVG